MLRGDKLKLAKRMRQAPSSAEAILWRHLCSRKAEGLKFRRQVPLGRYVADFVCEAHKLVVEADGPFHDPTYDAQRDAWLLSNGYLVLRFPNSMVHSRPELIMQDILDAAAARPTQSYRHIWP